MGIHLTSWITIQPYTNHGWIICNSIPMNITIATSYKASEYDHMTRINSSQEAILWPLIGFTSFRYNAIASGKLTVRYWKWPILNSWIHPINIGCGFSIGNWVDLPIKNGDLPWVLLLNHQGVTCFRTEQRLPRGDFLRGGSGSGSGAAAAFGASMVHGRRRGRNPVEKLWKSGWILQNRDIQLQKSGPNSSENPAELESEEENPLENRWNSMKKWMEREKHWKGSWHYKFELEKNVSSIVQSICGCYYAALPFTGMIGCFRVADCGREWCQFWHLLSLWWGTSG